MQVLPKRTNVPGMKQYFPRRFNPYMGYMSRRPYAPPYFYSPYGYGYGTATGSFEVVQLFCELTLSMRSNTHFRMRRIAH